MDCTRCERFIVGDVHMNAITIAHRGRLEEVLHFECVDDPFKLPPDQFPKYSDWWMERQRERIEAFTEHVNSEPAMLHRALHALPDHLSHDYVDEIYGEPEASARHEGLVAGYCNTCGRPVLYTGERDRDCRPVLAGHANNCGALQAAPERTQNGRRSNGSNGSASGAPSAPRQSRRVFECGNHEDPAAVSAPSAGPWTPAPEGPRDGHHRKPPAARPRPDRRRPGGPHSLLTQLRPLLRRWDLPALRRPGAGVRAVSRLFPGARRSPLPRQSAPNSLLRRAGKPCDGAPVPVVRP